MSKAAPDRPAAPSPAARYVIVASEYNREYVDGLMAHFSEELEALAPGSVKETYRVPGAFEIPLLIQEAATRLQPAAVVAFGVIIEGATAHAALVGQAVTEALMQVGLRLAIPVIHEVLLVKDEAQARERCLGERLNRGAEAARAAVRMVDAIRGIRG